MPGDFLGWHSDGLERASSSSVAGLASRRDRALSNVLSWALSEDMGLIYDEKTLAGFPISLW